MKKGIVMKNFILVCLICVAAVIAGCAKDTLPVPTEPLETVTPRPTFSHTVTRTATVSASSPTVTLTATITMTPTLTSTPYTMQIKCLDADPSLCAAKDTMIIHNAPTNNYGSFAAINVGAYGAASDKRRGLFYFDLSSIPSSAVINEARFVFNVDTFTPQNGSSLSMAAYAIDSAWVETVETWDTNSGGHYSSEIGTATVSSAGGWVMFLSAAKVQEWVSGAATNFGFILISQTESSATADDIIIFSSKEASNSALRPYLQVKYTLP